MNLNKFNKKNFEIFCFIQLHSNNFFLKKKNWYY